MGARDRSPELGRRVRAAAAACFLSLFPAAVFAQPRPSCETAGQVVVAEGEVSIIGTAGVIAVTISTIETSVCLGDKIVVGRRSRATVRIARSGQLVHLSQNSTMRLLEPRRNGRPLIDLDRGIIELLSPTDQPLDVETPYVTAGVEGTEFWVGYDPSAGISQVGVLEGRVSVSGTTGNALSLGAGQAAQARGSGVVEPLDIRPADGVRWAIYYPPVLWQLPRASALDPRVERAWQARQTGDEAAMVRELNALGPIDGLDAVSLDYYAAMLLAVGRIDEADAAITAAGGRDPSAPTPRALRAVIAVARNDAAAALKSTEGAERTGNAALIVARSYALQAAQRLVEARDDLAAGPPNDPLIAARLAEVELYLGNIAASRQATERAIALAPGMSRPRSILGFDLLAQGEFDAADAAFRQAIARDPGDPLPHIGQGLAEIRRGDPEQGRAELEVAVALDPDGAVYRTYLGQAYAGARQYDSAMREWSLAEKADRLDPTPLLYQGLAERTLNQPTEALRDIEASIARNDNRAVYRSPLLLNEDQATRTADLANIYRDLGFDQAALAQGYKALDDDPANPGAHRFLADTYPTLPRHEIAADSETLQSLLLQPLDVIPPAPRLSREGLGIVDPLGPTRLGYNEFAPLFAQNGVTALVDSFAGNFNTGGGTALVRGLYDNLSMSIGQFYSWTDGIHPNADLRRRITDAIVQPQLSDTLSLLAEFRYSDLDTGDPFNRFQSGNFDRFEIQTFDSRQYRLGGRYEPLPGLTFVGVWTDFNAHIYTAPEGYSLAEHLDQNTGEAGMYLTGGKFNLVAGGSVFSGKDATLEVVPAYDYTSAGISPVTDRSAWAYATFAPFRPLKLTLGGDLESLKTAGETIARASPKLGVTWEIVPGTTLRAALMEGVKRPLVGDPQPNVQTGQTIEPTQVAGFNQFYPDITGSRIKRWGAGLDQKMSNTVLAGAEWSQRILQVPGVPALIREQYGRAYVNWVPADRFAVNIEADWERIQPGDLGSLEIYDFTDVQLLRVPVELRYFDPSGVFALVRGTGVAERGSFLQAAGLIPPPPSPGHDAFASFDAALGWRIPGRAAIVSFELQNIADSHSRYQDTDPTNPRFFPRRTALLRMTFGL
jgi:tetratricopeptide (TPR) repeat protein